jgi:HD superfamily phosphohydrolase
MVEQKAEVNSLAVGQPPEVDLSQSTISRAATLPFPSPQAISKELRIFERNLPNDLLKSLLPAKYQDDKSYLFNSILEANKGTLSKQIAAMNRFTRSHLENIVTKDTLKDLGITCASEVIALAVDLLDLQPLRRLSGVKQMHAAYTSLFKDVLSHDRLGHSLEVGFNAARMGRRIGLNNSAILELAAAGFVHDVGHPPFSHSGERTLAELITDIIQLARLGCSNHFHHEAFGWSLILGKDIDGVLQRHGLSGKDVVAVLDHNHPFHAVIDWEDRLSYLARDLFGSTTGLTSEGGRSNKEIFSKRTRVVKVIDEFRKNVSQHEGKFVFSGSKTIPDKVLNLRLELLGEVSLTPNVLLVDGLLKKEIKRVISSKAITIDKFLKLSDQRVIDRMPKRVREALAHGVDKFYDQVNIFYDNELTKKGIDFVRSPSFTEDLVNAVAPHYSKTHLVLTAICAEDDKVASVRYLEEDEKGNPRVVNYTHRSDVYPWRRSASIFLSRDAPPEEAATFARRVQDYFDDEGLISTPSERSRMFRKTDYQRQMYSENRRLTS